MSSLVKQVGNIPAMSEVAIEKVRALESASLTLPQVDIKTTHLIHGGMYARTIMIPAGVVITGALIKIATILIIDGDVIVYIGDDIIDMNGYNVIPAASGRKQAFLAKSDVHLTMIFPSNAVNIEQAETEFTDEVNMLITRKQQIEEN